MHDCREVERKLIDLVFDELSEDERSRLLSEIEKCPECLGEYSSVCGTVRIFDRSVEAALPAESFWPQHHEALRQHLVANSSPALVHNEPFWKRLFWLRLHIPAPVAAMFVISLLTLSVLAFRSSTRPLAQTPAPEPPAAAQLSPRVIEVPVIREKVITRTVYVEKMRRDLNGDRGQLAKSRSSVPSVPEKDDGPDRIFTRASLTDFQPPDEMRIRVIKRSKSYEK
jgi:anti-sigma factor RsiW